MILILVPHRVVEVELAVAGDFGCPEVIAEGGVWPQQRVTGKMPGKEVAQEGKDAVRQWSGRHALRLRFHPLVLPLP